MIEKNKHLCENKTMRLLQNILSNPSGAAFAVMHWMILIFALEGEEHTQPFHLFHEPLLTKILVSLNSFPIDLSRAVINSFTNVFGRSIYTNSLGFCLLILTITFQWILIGYLVSKFLDQIKTEETIFRLEL